MAKYRKITDPAKMVTDEVVFKHLERQGIDKDYVALCEGYTKSHPTVKVYRDEVSKQMIACCSGLPKVTPQGASIIPQWHRSPSGVYLADENLFTAKIKSGESHVVVGKREALWDPTVYLNGKEQSCGKPTLLETDPNNENYHHNVLEWDYGLCRRYLRLIEGTILELWIFNENPGGDVVIKSNVKGNLQAKGYYAIDAQRKPLVGFEVVGDEKQVPGTAFEDAAYPVIVDDTYTGYSTTSDGEVTKYGGSSDSYADVHDAATGGVFDDYDYIYIGQYDEGSGYRDIFRSFFFFDTSELSGTLSAATLSLYGYSDHADTDFDMVVQNGQPTYPHDSLEAGDYLYSHYSGDGGSLNTSGFSTAGYNDIVLDATGRGWINKDGTTKLCVRSSRDIDSDVPTGREYVLVYTAEKGTGYKPKLVVTYTPAYVPRHGFVNFQGPGVL